MMPRAGGQYVYLREAFSPLWGFLYGWTLFLVIQTGTIAAVGVAFARFLGVLWPTIAEDHYLIAPVHLSTGYALSLSTAQVIAVALIALLTWTNTRGIEYGRIIQNVFTVAKTGALIALIGVGLALGWNADAVSANFGDMWTPRGQVDIVAGLSAATAFGLFVGLCVAQTGSLFSSDAWNNITFTAGEVKDPRRNLPLALAFGTGLVTALYLLANVAYLVTLPLSAIQQAPCDRVATATLDTILPGLGATLMAAAIMISTFGCNNGLILAGARAYYAMARDGLFFKRVGELNVGERPGSRVGAARVLVGAAGAAAHLRPGDGPIRKSLRQPARLRDLGGADLLHPHHRRHLPSARHAPGCRTAVPRVWLPGRARALHCRRRDDPAGALRVPSRHDMAGPGDRVAGRAGLLRVEEEELTIADGRLPITNYADWDRMTNHGRPVEKPARVPAIPSHQACGTARHRSVRTS